MYYDLQNNFKESISQPENEYIAVIPFEEAGNIQIVNYYSNEIYTLFKKSRFSKIEIFSDYIYGTITVPEILLEDNSYFSFIYTKRHLIFIDKNDYIHQLFSNIIKNHKPDLASSALVLYYILDNVIYYDLEKISMLQQTLSHLEQEILKNHTRQPNPHISNYRNSTMKLYHYYIQLSGICSNLAENTQTFFTSEEQAHFSLLSKKTTLLSQEAQQLWEYTSQLRDIYQQQLEVHQNSIMKFLTIVTTIFMPLTLLTGWYGMNFSYMPGLNKKYGSLVLLIICIIIVIVLCLIFKKKKWW